MDQKLLDELTAAKVQLREAQSTREQCERSIEEARQQEGEARKRYSEALDAVARAA